MKTSFDSTTLSSSASDQILSVKPGKSVRAPLAVEQLRGHFSRRVVSLVKLFTNQNN
jgi:hypothetical protein